MLFRSDIVRAQWDTWCYFHEGTYHLYYLITETSPGEGVGVATSSDGVHWQDHGWVLRPSDKMVNFLGTGSVWPDPVQRGRFLCNYSEFRLDETGRQRQCILFAWSDDLLRWTKFGDDFMSRIDERFYERYGRWDCICAIPRPEGGYFGTWTATRTGRAKQNGGIGFGLSEDGLRWQALPAAVVEPDADESGALVRLDGRIHAVFGRFDDPRDVGMFAYAAAAPEGPYRQAERNPCLLRGWHSWFARFFQTPDGTLVNHHAMDGAKLPNDRMITYAAPFKKLAIDREGVQRWLWWPGNDRLKGREIRPCEGGDFQAGVMIEGVLPPAPQPDATEMQFEVDGSAYAIRLPGPGRAEFLRHDPATNAWVSLQQADRHGSDAGKGAFRLLARRGMLELYVDDHFMECCALGCPNGRRIQFVSSENPRGAGSLRGWQMTL